MSSPNFILSRPNSSRAIETISRALSDVIYELFGKFKLSFEVTVVGELSNHLRDVLNKLKIDSQVLRLSSLNFDCALLLNRASIFFIQSMKLLQDFFVSDCLGIHHEKNNWPKSIKFLFYIEKFFNDSEIPSRQPNRYHGDYSHYSYFLQNFKHEIQLKTFEWWTQNACNQTQLVTLNTFNKSTQEWQNHLVINEKFQNFHGCVLTMVAKMFLFEMMEMLSANNMLWMYKFAEEFHKETKDFDNIILNVYAERGNFTYLRYRDTQWDAHKSVTVAVRQTSAIHFVGSHYGKILDDFVFRVMIPATESYTSYEKCILPFDDQTWMFLGLVFVAAFVMIFIINLMSQNVKDLVYGRGVKVPAFNVLGTFFGIGQTKLPENNFARIILMSFIMFCLIFRTAYQGVFFEMFTTDMKKPPPKTFLDLKAGNYTLIALELTNDGKDKSIIVELGKWRSLDELPRLKSESINDAASSFNELSNPKTRKAILIDNKSYYIVSNFFGSKSPNLMEEPATTVQIAIQTEFNNFIYPLVTRTTDRLAEAGIYIHFYDYILKSTFHTPLENDEPKVFSTEDLNFGFVIWLAACGFSISSFMSEIVYHYGKMWGKNMLQNIIVLYYLIKFIKDRLRRVGM